MSVAKMLEAGIVLETISKVCGRVFPAVASLRNEHCKRKQQNCKGK